MSPSKLVATSLIIVGLFVVLFRQPSVIISQSSEPLRRIAALETRVAKLESTPVVTPSPIKFATDGELIDTLGIPYEFVHIDPDLQVAGWEAYEDQKGRWAVAGSVLNNHPTDRLLGIDFQITFYKGQRVVLGLSANPKGRFVDPGKLLPFEITALVEPDKFDRYTVEISASEWEPAP